MLKICLKAYFVKGEKWQASLLNWPPGGRAYLVAEIRNWTFWELGSTHGDENLSVGILCQSGKNGTPLFDIGHQRAAFILKTK